MTTWHTDKFASYGSTTLNDAIDKAIKASGMSDDQRYFKVVSCGRGVVIMPDSDRTQAAKAGEVMKMLGANERLIKYVRNDPSTIGNAPIEMELPKSAASESRLDFTLYDDCRDLRNYVKITNAQYDFLNWLSENDYLSYDMNWEAGHEIPNIKII